MMKGHEIFLSINRCETSLTCAKEMLTSTLTIQAATAIEDQDRCLTKYESVRCRELTDCTQPCRALR